MKIFFSVNHSGCAFWRCRQPAEMIKKLGLADVRVFSQYDTAREELKEILNWCEIIVTQCPAGVDSIALALEYQKMGKVVVSDYDDLVYSCSPFNPAYKTLGLSEVNVIDLEGKKQELWKDNVNGFSIKDNYIRCRSQRDLFRVLDGVTVTNEYLKSRYIEIEPEVANKIHVVENAINFDLFYPFAKYNKSDKIRIGWLASSSHLNEIWLVRDIIKKLYAKYGDKILFVQLGDVKELAKAFDSTKMEYHQFVDLCIYPLKLASLNLDIGICPLVDDEFNRHKSQLKWSEYASMRIPSVCSRLAPYSCVEEGVTGYLAADANEWVEKLSLLIDSEELRRKIGAAAYARNFSDFNLEKTAVKWAKTFEQIYQSVMR